MNAKLRKSLVIIAAVIMFLLLAVSTAVPAFAAESDMTVQSNEKFEVVEPKYEGDTNSNVTLPDAPVKDGYTFKGWSVDGSTELHNAGESIVNNDGHKLQLQPVYEAKSATPEATSAPVTTEKDTSSTQQNSSDVAVQNAAEIDVDNALYKAFGVALLGLVLIIVLGLIRMRLNECSVMGPVIGIVASLVAIGVMIIVMYYMLYAGVASVTSLRASNTAIMPVPFFIYR